MPKRFVVCVLLVGLLAGAAVADIIHLKNGRQLEGQILSEEGGKLKVKTVAGVVEIARADVARIEVKKTPAQEYGERLAALAPDDAEGYYQLALYCRENGLKKEEKELYAKVLGIDGQHAGANAAVGNVEYEGEWMTPAERDRRKGSADDAEMRAKGFVQYEGRWVTPEEKENLEKGLVRHDGKWMTPDEVKIAQGFVKLNGKWVRKEDLERERLKDLYGGWMEIDVNVVFSEHFAAVGPYTEEELEALCRGGEMAYAQFCQVFDVPDGEGLFDGAEADDGRTRLQIVYAKRAIEYVRVVQGMKERFPEDIPEARAELMQRQKGFYFVYPGCYVIGYQMPNPFEQVRASVIHKASHVLLMRWHYTSGFFPWWLIEGLGTYQEISALGHCDTFCITEGGYGAGEDPAKQKWAGMSRWKEIVKAQVAGLSDRGLIGLSKCGLNELNFRDIAKCWSVCEWLIANHRKEFIRLVDNLKARMDFVDAVQSAFGKSPEQLDKEWHDYVRDNY